ncbi:cell surface protein [Haloarchaeobius baliensis]|uniref:cell surface protein n=1 Tax=Haloarchaeobius baliensis TaxID=1670458 RepID=UPI003F881966
MARHDSTAGRHARIAIPAAAAAFVLALALAPALAGADVGAAGAADASVQTDDPTLAVADASVDPGGTTETTLTLSAVPDGLSGFNVTVAVADTETATITDAALAEPFPAIGDGSVVVADDGSAARLKSADLDDEVGTGDGPVALGTVTLAGGSTGTVDLVLSVEQVDDDGSRVDPAADDGLLTVGDVSTATPTVTATPTSVPTTDQPGTSTATDQPGTGPAPTTTDDDGSVGLGFGAAGGLLTAVALALALVAGRRY